MKSQDISASIEDKYALIGPLGKGATGGVYLAQKLFGDQKRVAIKVIPHTPHSHGVAARAKREFEALQALSSPYVVRPIECIQQDGATIYVMEYLSGGTLSERFASNTTPSSSELCRLLFELASGLTAIHEAGLIHRDIKPSNILFDEKDSAHIVDFGATRAQSDQSLTLEGFMIGTPKYLPPEYIETGESDARGDIYSLGVLAYEYLTGASPFGSKKGEELLLDRFRPVKVDPARIPTSTPEAVIKIIEKCLETSVSRRFQSARELSEKLVSEGLWVHKVHFSDDEKRMGIKAKLIEKIAVFQNLIGF